MVLYVIISSGIEQSHNKKLFLTKENITFKLKE